MKKRNKKFKIEKGPKEKPLNLGLKPSLKGDFYGFGRHQDREDGIKTWRTEARPRGRGGRLRIKIFFSSCNIHFIGL